MKKLLLAVVIAMVALMLVVGGCSSGPDYKAKSNKVLTSYYQDAATKAGVGVPVIDEGIADYDQWESVKGKLMVTKNTYTLAGVKGIKHDYVMTWRMKTGELVKVVIDGKKIMYNEDLMWKAMDDK